MTTPQPTPATPGNAEDRRVTDRRRRATPMLSRFTLSGGRRVGDRRTEAAVNQYVDRYPTWLCVSLAAIGALCAADAVLTLLHLQRGGAEANPIMDALIRAVSPTQFLLLKCLVTNAGLLVLCLHQNFRYVRPVIATLLALYCALLVYHVYLTVAV